MSVCVDPLFVCVPNPRWRWTQASHLVADSVDELHDFAWRLGLKRAWFQNGSSLPHYDLTPGMRARAVAMGAIEISREQIVERIRAHRKQRQEAYRARSV